MKKDYTRDVDKDMITELKEKGRFSPFVDFVKNNSDLALCFRGNSSSKGNVIIYKNNHKMWELYFGNGRVPVVKIELNHSRYMEWEEIEKNIHKLFAMGFRRKDGTKSMEDIIKVSERKEKKKIVGYNYNLDYLLYYPEKVDGSKQVKEVIGNVIKPSYDILCEMQKSFFKDRGSDDPINSIKSHYFAINKNHKDKNESMTAHNDPCIEKHVQSKLFLSNHNFKDGLFIYDLEFSQPGIKELDIRDKNKPDMFGIRFDENGKMKSLCMIEVKSTESALNGASGLKEHKDGMEEYLTKKYGEKKVINDRKNEAFKIMEHYYDLGLYKVRDNYNKNDHTEDEFLNLPVEIVFLLTDDAASRYRNNSDYKTMLQGYKNCSGFIVQSRKYVSVSKLFAD